MYWLRALFLIQGTKDVIFLQTLYTHCEGELQLESLDETVVHKIEWCSDPFGALILAMTTMKDHGNTQYRIMCRLVGPDTVRAVSIALDKTTKETPFEDSLIQEWADSMDVAIQYEIDRKNDLGYKHKWPETELKSTLDLVRAARCSKLVTFVLPLKKGVVVSNAKAEYLVDVALRKGDEDPVSGLVFDKDDGFGSIWDENSEVCKELNTIVTTWQESKYIKTIPQLLEESLLTEPSQK